MSVTEKRHSDLERAEGRRQQVLNAAEICFSRKGFHGTSMSEISKEAGMSAGHIYNYFDGKDAIIASFVQSNVDRVSALMRDLALRDDPLQSIVDDAGLRVSESLDPKVWPLPLEIFAESARNPQIAAMLHDSDMRSRGQLLAILKAARIKRGLPADDALLLGRIETLIAMFQGLQIRALHNPNLDEVAVSAGFRHALTALLLNP